MILFSFVNLNVIKKTSSKTELKKKTYQLCLLLRVKGPDMVPTMVTTFPYIPYDQSQRVHHVHSVN